jgi:NAD-dependent SIR2 family protein deacetylase
LRLPEGKSCVVTRAGVFAESGLSTFRDKAGAAIWSKLDPMKVATPRPLLLAFSSNMGVHKI